MMSMVIVTLAVQRAEEAEEQEGDQQFMIVAQEYQHLEIQESILAKTVVTTTLLAVISA